MQADTQDSLLLALNWTTDELRQAPGAAGELFSASGPAHRIPSPTTLGSEWPIPDSQLFFNGPSGLSGGDN